jgi:hypothetical protein
VKLLKLLKSREGSQAWWLMAIVLSPENTVKIKGKGAGN